MSDQTTIEAAHAVQPRMTATYSPDDNKLRLYSSTRLAREIYDRVKAAGFKWAPKQELFVAPMWTPERADLLIELCGEIGDEDTSLVDRAEDRADRFEDYGEKRAADADAAHKAVARIADNIPLGQPILVGHHSERHARRDAERIENGMRRAVKMWETSKYWERRARGAIAHAKYKERPDVRHRRIKGLESDKRKQEKERDEASKLLDIYSDPEAKSAKLRDGRELLPALLKTYRSGLSFEQQNAYEKQQLSFDAAMTAAVKNLSAHVDHANRWIAHIDLRLGYERAMLDEQGGTAADKFPIEIGGRVLARHWRARGKGWLVVTRVNRANERINSVSTTEGVIDIEAVTEYKAPEIADVEKVKKASKLPPLVNYPGEGFRHMLKAEYDGHAKHSDFYHVKRIAATDKGGAHRCRHAPKEGGPYYDVIGVYLTDIKRSDPPAPSAAPSEPVAFEFQPAPALERAMRRAGVPSAPTPFDDMRERLKQGVQVVNAPQLFPTPQTLAARMVELADIKPGMRVLEPSAGTGNIVQEIVNTGARVTVVEINRPLLDALRLRYPTLERSVCDDFLERRDSLLPPGETFKRVVMNPPFADGQDIAHVQHAYALLGCGGKLVAIMSAGVKFRQEKKYAAMRALIKECGSMEDLPEDTFKESGTSVRTVLVTLDK